MITTFFVKRVTEISRLLTTKFFILLFFSTVQLISQKCSGNSTATFCLVGSTSNYAFIQLINKSGVKSFTIDKQRSGSLSVFNFCYNYTTDHPLDLKTSIIGIDRYVYEGTDSAPIDINIPASWSDGAMTYQWQISNLKSSSIKFSDIQQFSFLLISKAYLLTLRLHILNIKQNV